MHRDYAFVISSVTLCNLLQKRTVVVRTGEVGWFYKLSWVVVPTLAAAAVGVMSFSPPDFTSARALFSVSAVWAGITGLIWLFQTVEGLSVRIFVGILIVVYVLIGLPVGLHYVKYRDELTREAANQPKPETRNPNALYQLGILVGEVQGAVITPARGEAYFQFGHFSAQINPNERFEYQEWSLICSDLPPPKDGFVGSTSLLIAGLKCKLDDKRRLPGGP